MREWVIPAVGVALSPLPILAILLVLGGRNPVVHGGAFWLAWTIGITAPTITFVVVADRTDAIDDQVTALAVAEIGIGVVFLAAACLAFQRRRERSDTPSWLDALDRSGPLRAAGLALVLSSGNPKNLALMLTAAVAIVQDGQPAVGGAGFVALAVSTVSLLFVSYTAFSSRAGPTLARLRDAVARNDRRLAILIGIAVGAFFLADGISSL